MCILILDLLPNISLQPSGFGQTIVGQQQDVICSLYVPPFMDPDTIELGWLNEEDIITDDSRVTIENDYLYDSTLVTIIHFDPLSEVDEGKYTCYASINGLLIFSSTDLQGFTSKSL